MGAQYTPKANKAVAEARERLMELFRQKEALQIEIAKQQRRVAALAALVEESQEADQIADLNLGGLTDAVRGVLMAAGDFGLSSIDIRTRLIQLYFPVNEYKNFLASLHSVLNRLVRAKEVKEIVLRSAQSGGDREETRYCWIQKFRDPGRFNRSRSTRSW